MAKFAATSSQLAGTGGTAVESQSCGSTSSDDPPSHSSVRSARRRSAKATAEAKLAACFARIAELEQKLAAAEQAGAGKSVRVALRELCKLYRSWSALEPDADEPLPRAERTFTGRIVACGATPATPTPLLVACAMVPATCVP